MSETPLEQVERHVHEAEDRIARQIDLVAKMERGGHEEMARLGREMLAIMANFLEVSRKHRTRLLQSN